MAKSQDRQKAKEKRPSRAERRAEALSKIFSVGSFSATDILLAYASDAVDVIATEKSLLRFKQSEAADVDDEMRRAALIELRCVCQYEQDSVRDCLDLPVGPSEAEVRAAKRQGRDPYPPSVYYNPGGGNLRNTLWQCCNRCGWGIPGMRDVESFRTHQDVLDYVQCVEDWICRQELQFQDYVTNKENIHSDDFRVVIWNGERFTFSPLEAKCVRVLWCAFLNGLLELSQVEVLQEVDTYSIRLADVFKGHDSWRRLIVEGSKKGLYRLAATQLPVAQATRNSTQNTTQTPTTQ
jgi:hypothetical protein